MTDRNALEPRIAETEWLRYSYVRAGDGPPVVLLPGAGGWRLTFHAAVAALATKYTVYAVDPPGQGATRVTDPSRALDVDSIAGSIGELLDVVGLPTTAIIGHSWGGGFALRFAELHPDRVDRLALLAPGGLAVTDVWEFRLLRLPLIGELATRFTSTASMRHMARKSFANRDRMPSDALLGEAARSLRSGSDSSALRRDMLRVERTVDWTDTERDLGLVMCPTLILWGDEDQYFPVRLLGRFTTRLPRAEAHVLRGCGHSLHDDCPGRVYPLLEAFLAGRE